MRLVVIRHGIAEERESFSESHQADELRPLTAKGMKRMRRAAQGLARTLPGIDRLASSPLVRARQTAEIVAATYGGLEITELDELSPGTGVDELTARLRGLDEPGTVAVVGHEPDLGRLVSACLGVPDRSVVELKKGAACLLDFPGEAGLGRATLLWSLTPAQLRDLAEST